MLRTQFEEDLKNLHDQFSTMGNIVSNSIEKATRSFIEHDKNLAKEVIEADNEVNIMELNLDKKSFEMIALQQPVTTDLRMIVTVMKASSDLERMGDHAVSIAKATIRVKGNKRNLEIEKNISEMANFVTQMVKDVLEAYVKEDVRWAKEIAKNDEQVNKYFQNIYELSIHSMQTDPETVIVGTDYLQVAGFLERIGDYVTNICEWIVYLRTGKIYELNANRHIEG